MKQPLVNNNIRLVTGCMGISLLMMGCQPVAPNTQKTQPIENQTTVTSIVTPIKNSSQSNGAKAEQSNISDSEDIAKRLEISYARNAAYRNDECPKLVEFQSLTQTITRQGEQLPTDHCEYLVYLNQGDTLNVHVSDNMQASLISPIWFDFRNGSYKASRYDKYTLRLSYDGTRYHPVNFRYDISLIKNGEKLN